MFLFGTDFMIHILEGEEFIHMMILAMLKHFEAYLLFENDERVPRDH